MRHQIRNSFGRVLQVLLPVALLVVFYYTYESTPTWWTIILPVGLFVLLLLNTVNTLAFLQAESLRPKSSVAVVAPLVFFAGTFLISEFAGPELFGKETWAAIFSGEKALSSFDKEEMTMAFGYIILMLTLFVTTWNLTAKSMKHWVAGVHTPSPSIYEPVKSARRFRTTHEVIVEMLRGFPSELARYDQKVGLTASNEADFRTALVWLNEQFAREAGLPLPDNIGEIVGAEYQGTADEEEALFEQSEKFTIHANGGGPSPALRTAMPELDYQRVLEKWVQTAPTVPFPGTGGKSLPEVVRETMTAKQTTPPLNHSWVLEVLHICAHAAQNFMWNPTDAGNYDPKAMKAKDLLDRAMPLFGGNLQKMLTVRDSLVATLQHHGLSKEAEEKAKEDPRKVLQGVVAAYRQATWTVTSTPIAGPEGSTVEGEAKLLIEATTILSDPEKAVKGVPSLSTAKMVGELLGKVQPVPVGTHGDTLKSLLTTFHGRRVKAVATAPAGSAQNPFEETLKRCAVMRALNDGNPSSPDVESASGKAEVADGIEALRLFTEVDAWVLFGQFESGVQHIYLHGTNSKAVASVNAALPQVHDDIVSATMKALGEKDDTPQPAEPLAQTAFLKRLQRFLNTAERPARQGLDRSKTTA